MTDVVTLCPECGEDTRLITDTIGDRLLLIRCENQGCDFVEVAELEPDREAA